MDKGKNVTFDKADKFGNKLGIEECTLSNWENTKKFYREKDILCMILNIE